MQEKVFIVGPFSDFGGREVEVNFIAKSLSYNFDVSVFSTGYMTEKSVAVQGLKIIRSYSLPKILFNQSRIIRISSYLSKAINNGKKKVDDYTNNFLSKRIFSLEKLSLNCIYREIEQADIVILCVQLSSKFLPEIVEYCYQNKIPCLVRTTGTIRELSENQFRFLKKIKIFIHHSEENARNLNSQIRLPYVVIDQCALEENILVTLPIVKNSPLRFGFLGRLSEEKGILPLADFFTKTNFSFVVAGEGEQKEKLLSLIESKNNCKYIGSLSINEIVDFFNQIDVLIISSYEESGPLVGLEAMAAGKIILSTKVGAMLERLEDVNKTFWFDIENISSLNSKILEINELSLIELNNLAMVMREKYLNMHSSKFIASKYLKLVYMMTK